LAQFITTGETPHPIWTTVGWKLCFSSTPEESPGKRGMPAMEYIRKELTRKRVTLRLLWLEYRQANPDGYQYSHCFSDAKSEYAKIYICQNMP
jgi:hypothetical protein